MRPKFTVCIPTLNHHDLLKKAISSVKNQTFTDFEAFIMADGGDQWVKEYVNKLDDKRFTYRQSANIGGHWGFPILNWCLKDLATGEYFTTLDDDDYLLPTYFEEFNRIITEHEIEKNVKPNLAMCGCQHYHPDIGRLGPVPINCAIDLIQICPNIDFVRENNLYYEYKKWGMYTDGHYAEKMATFNNYCTTEKVTCLFQPSEYTINYFLKYGHVEIFEGRLINY